MNRQVADSRPLSRDDVLTLAAAARELEVPSAEVRAWLFRAGLVRSVLGRERVVWGDVLEELRGGRGQQGRRTVPPAKEPRQTTRFG